ncbi:MAG: carboxysome shell carbonic anhydrase, partial [Pseudomonadota bacterium]
AQRWLKLAPPALERAQPAAHAPAVASADWAAGLAPRKFPDCAANKPLWEYEQTVRGAFDAIVPALREIAALQHESDFAARAQRIAHDKLGIALPQTLLQDAWVETLDMRALYAHAVCQTYRRLHEQERALQEREQEQARAVRKFFLECGFHGVDMSPCADGRLKGLVTYILRLPRGAVHREAYAGALFDVEESMRRWIETELRRHREGAPNTADEPTQYLKIAVYHWSGADRHEGCAAHGGDARRAAEAGLERLLAFRQAIENSFCCGASVATLLIGVNTDNDAIRVHVPDAGGALSLYRFVDNQTVYEQVMQGAQPRAAVVEALERALAAQGWGEAQGRPAPGVLRMIAFLLENNLQQMDYVDVFHGGRYADLGHQERFISAGNGVSGVQLRNLAYYAHMDTLEEGAADLDVGIKIFGKLNVAHGLPAPVILHVCFNPAAPDARERALRRALRLRDAIRARYADLAQARLLSVFVSLQNQSDGGVEFVDE